MEKQETKFELERKKVETTKIEAQASMVTADTTRIKVISGSRNLS